MSFKRKVIWKKNTWMNQSLNTGQWSLVMNNNILSCYSTAKEKICDDDQRVMRCKTLLFLSMDNLGALGGNQCQSPNLLTRICFHSKPRTLRYLWTGFKGAAWHFFAFCVGYTLPRIEACVEFHCDSVIGPPVSFGRTLWATSRQ